MQESPDDTKPAELKKLENSPTKNNEIKNKDVRLFLNSLSKQGYQVDANESDAATPVEENVTLSGVDSSASNLLCVIHLYVREASRRYKIEINYNTKTDTVDSVARDLISQLHLDASNYMQAITALIEASLIQTYNCLGLREKDIQDAKSVFVHLKGIREEYLDLIRICVCIYVDKDTTN